MKEPLISEKIFLFLLYLLSFILCLHSPFFNQNFISYMITIFISSFLIFTIAFIIRNFSIFNIFRNYIYIDKKKYFSLLECKEYYQKENLNNQQAIFLNGSFHCEEERAFNDKYFLYGYELTFLNKKNDYDYSEFLLNIKNYKNQNEFLFFIENGDTKNIKSFIENKKITLFKEHLILLNHSQLSYEKNKIILNIFKPLYNDLFKNDLINYDLKKLIQDSIKFKQDQITQFLLDNYKNKLTYAELLNLFYYIGLYNRESLFVNNFELINIKDKNFYIADEYQVEIMFSHILNNFSFKSINMFLNNKLLYNNIKGTDKFSKKIKEIKMKAKASTSLISF